ncbi:uncharacterized protein J3D65DRAFT_635151 [Phyllosticta citribraziliensis]|uniref:F-box domain-containing protein n=1 Tax=Phyllosticta citribraziliensis TaxID=989973 RepID=A0ABR1LDL8_9PEZI
MADSSACNGSECGSETYTPIEELPTKLVAAITSYLDPVDRKRLRLVSITMLNHLNEIMKPAFQNLRCRPLLSELYSLAEFSTDSPLAKEVRSLTFTFFDSAAVKQDLKDLRDGKGHGLMICENIKSEMKEEGGIERVHSVFALQQCQAMIARVIRGLEGVTTLGLVFKTAPVFFIPPEFLREPHMYQDMIVGRLLPRIEKPLMVRVYDPPMRWGFSWTGTHASAMSYETLTPSTQLVRNCPSPEDETWFANMGWFFLLAGHQLKSLHLHNVIVPLQVVEEVLEDVKNLEVLSITESILLEDAPIYPPALIDPGSKLQKSLRELSLRFCSGATHPLPRLFKAFREGGRLERFQFEQIEGIWFDWDKTGTFDDGSSVPAMIEKIGMKKTLERMEQSCCWGMTPRHPRLAELFPPNIDA